MKELLRCIIKSLLKIFYVFPVDDNKVYLMNFNGDKYGLDAKAFVEFLKQNYPEQYRIYWETIDKNRLGIIEGITSVGKFSLIGFFHYMTAGIILCNLTPRSYIPFRKKQIIINTWHGYPMKKVGKYALRYNQSAYEIASCFPSHSEEYTEMVLKDSFDYDRDIICCGVPRNDIFFTTDKEIKRKKIKDAIGVSGKIALFAPTFRGDYEYEESEMDIGRLQDSLERKTGEKWTILFRLHPQLVGRFSSFFFNIMDVSEYPDMQELLLISDILITDYSSCAWDFSQQRKPVFLFTTDLKKYSDNRGLYFPLERLPYPLAEDNDELEHNIMEFDYDIYKIRLEKYFKRVYNYESGRSCQSLLNYVNKKRKKS